MRGQERSNRQEMQEMQKLKPKVEKEGKIPLDSSPTGIWL